MKSLLPTLKKIQYFRLVNKALGNSHYFPMGGLLLLTACSTPHIPTTVRTTGMPNPELALQKSMEHVNKDMSRITALQPQVLPNANIPVELQKNIAFFFNGKLEKATDILANKIGYVISVEKLKTIKSLYITTRFQNITIFEALHSLGELVGKHADIKIDTNNHLIRVIYHEN